MLYIRHEGHTLEYDVFQLLNLFIDSKDYIVTNNEDEALEILQGSLLVCKKTEQNDHSIVQVTLSKNQELLYSDEEQINAHMFIDDYHYRRSIKRKLLKHVYTAMSLITESKTPWGILVGVRPVKIVHEMLDLGHDDSYIRNELTTEFCIRTDKVDLLLSVAYAERPTVYPIDPKSISIYVSIPFCPTRCVYCSFPSNSGKLKLKLVDSYLDTLIHELKTVGSQSTDRYVETLYIGGGTPTTLNGEQLKRIIDTVKSYYDVSKIKEITVEAGRPDTITLEKLETLKACNVDRICINPQSMNDTTINLIGRKHTVKDIETVYAMANKVGFKTINMDLILGLPGETMNEVKNTFQWIEKFRPQNVTVHTLALKKNSDLRHQVGNHLVTEESDMNAMLEYAAHAMKDLELYPYYMYRQKYMTGNLENVGYALKGHESIYNMQIMEEKQDIWAFGAGAVSKMCFPEEDRFERVPNVKGLEEYIERVDEMIQRKLKFVNTL